MFTRLLFQVQAHVEGDAPDEERCNTTMIPFPLELPNTEEAAAAVADLLLALANTYHEGCLKIGGYTQEDYLAEVQKMFPEGTTPNPDTAIAMPDQSRTEPEGQDPRLKVLDISRASVQ